MIITTEGTNPARYAGQSTPNNGYYATITLSIDELQFVDQDIADKFRGYVYTSGMPLQVQLIREIQKLLIVIKEANNQ
jgi:hypothetical protein